jgi:hypothetical protein
MSELKKMKRNNSQPDFYIFLIMHMHTLILSDSDFFNFMLEITKLSYLKSKSQRRRSVKI